MQTTVELKFRISDSEAMCKLLEQKTGVAGAWYSHSDSYFEGPKNGRLFLRRSYKRGDLVYVTEAVAGDVRFSHCWVYPIVDTKVMSALLKAAFAVRAELSKSRLSFCSKDLRVHVDTVPGNESFLKLEAEVSETDDLADVLESLYSWADSLGILRSDEARETYLDLVLRQEGLLRILRQQIAAVKEVMKADTSLPAEQLMRRVKKARKLAAASLGISDQLDSEFERLCRQAVSNDRY
ncbi:class IV adenylate cyclase [Propionivibrio dicarboxylicus]|uniref:Adenylyl cyclase CyaB, putative n=1 Tax=Propionivibrio dicarboxylicus TaxID=83767 RepID=A0A1G8NKJ9_9RHOO|nr:class IV adenylate cyclase [Propionivibrio dicarboxylicus]SDI80754.1 adenylyl cyclase CyaB, putative [Propionivibrio dicarboxylicus]